jgi:hypothetical protein
MDKEKKEKEKKGGGKSGHLVCPRSRDMCVNEYGTTQMKIFLLSY